MAEDGGGAGDEVEELEIRHKDEARRLDFQSKVARLRKTMADRGIQSALIMTVHNFFWLTSGGRNYVGLNTEKGVASVFVDSDRVVLVTSNIEGERIAAEELAGLGKIQVFAKPWYWDDSAHLNRLITLGRGFRPEPDTGDILGPLMAELRATLTPFEMGKYRTLGRQCGEVVGEVARQVRRGMTERDVAGMLAGACYTRGIHPVVLLVGADERMDRWRHPLPTANVLKDRLIIVLCGRRHGLIASLSRVLHVGPVPPDSELRRKHDAVTYVDAVAIANTRVGNTSTAIMSAIQTAYDERGYCDEWLHHHQGGLTGYKSREWKAEPGVKYYVEPNQAFAWNPSIAGTRSEDTILLAGGGEGCSGEGSAGPGAAVQERPEVQAPASLPAEVLTPTPCWPMITHVVNGIPVARPDILVLEP